MKRTHAAGTWIGSGLVAAAIIATVAGGIVAIRSLTTHAALAQGESSPPGFQPFAAPGAPKQENAFLKIGNIKGKATTKGFSDQIVFQSMSYGVQQAGEWEEGDRLSGRITTFADLTILKEMDAASPSLAVACATKEQFPKAEISLVSGKETYLKVTLENVIVSSVSVAFQAGEARPTETVTLHYRKATWEWGTAKAGYDLGKNVKT